MALIAFDLWLGWLAWSDLRKRTLPDAGVFGLWLAALLTHPHWVNILVSLAVASVGLVFAAYAPQLMAGGDAKLAGACAALCGAALAVPMLMTGFVLAGIASLTVHRGTPVPLGTYLCASTALALAGGLGWMQV